MKTNTPRTDYIVSKCQPPIDAETAFATMNDHAEYLEVKLTAVTEQRDQWKDKYIQQNKDLGHELRDPNGTIWSECKRLQTELDAVTKQRDGLRSGIDYASDQLHTVTEQRDRLAEACKKLMAIIGETNSLIDDYWVSEDEMDEAWNIADEALQSLTTNKQ
jgi:chromosome segregation ATPase